MTSAGPVNSWRTEKHFCERVVSGRRSLHHPGAFSNHGPNEWKMPLLWSSLRWWEKPGDKTGGPMGLPTEHRLAKPGIAQVFWCPLILSLICEDQQVGLSSYVWIGDLLVITSCWPSAVPWCPLRQERVSLVSFAGIGKARPLSPAVGEEAAMRREGRAPVPSHRLCMRLLPSSSSIGQILGFLLWGQSTHPFLGLALACPIPSDQSDGQAGAALVPLWPPTPVWSGGTKDRSWQTRPLAILFVWKYSINIHNTTTLCLWNQVTVTAVLQQKLLIT